MHNKTMSRSVSFELHTKKKRKKKKERKRKLKSTNSSRTTLIQSKGGGGSYRLFCYNYTLWRLLSWISDRHNKTVIW